MMNVSFLKNKYSSNLSWTLIEKSISIVGVFIIGILVINYLGPVEFGILSYSLSYISFFSFIVSLGLDGIISREIVSNPKHSKIIVSTSFLMKISSLVFVVFLVNFISIFLDNSQQIKIIISIISLNLLQEPFNVFSTYFQAIVNIRNVSFSIMISKLLLIIFKLLLIYFQFSLIYFVIVDAIVLIFLSTSFMILYLRFNKLRVKDLLKFDKKMALNLFKDSWPLMISSGAILLYMRFDQIMIKEMISLEELGYYSVSVKIAECWYFIPMTVTSVLFPILIKSKKDSLVMYKHRLNQLFFSCTIISLLFCLPMYFYSEFIVNSFFTNNFNSSSTSLSILSIAGIFVSMGYVNGKWMVIENYTKLSLLRNVLGLVINVILNLILIPMFGIAGAATSTLISVAFASNFFFLFHNKTREIFYLQNKSIFYLNFKNKL